MTRNRRLVTAMISPPAAPLPGGALYPRQPGFTQVPSGRYEYGQSECIPTSHGGQSYPSATDALEAYICEYEGKDARRSRDVEELLINRCKIHAFGGDDTKHVDNAQDKLRRYLAIKRVVDQSYDKLAHQEHSRDTFRSSTNGTLPSVRDITNGYSANLDHLNIDSFGYIRNPHSANFHNSGAPYGEESWREKLPSHCQLDFIKDRLRDDYKYLASNGYRVNLSDSSIDVKPKENGFYQYPDPREWDTNSRPSRIDQDRDRYHTRSLSSDSRRPPGYHDDPNDTFSQLTSAKRRPAAKRGTSVPSWVDALDVTDTASRLGLHEHSHHGNSTIVTGLGQRPLSHSNKAVSTPILNRETENLLSTPKKQLRFDLDLSRSTLDHTTEGLVALKLNPAENELENTDTARRLSTYANHGLTVSSPPKNGILKSGSGKSKQLDVSFTTEDVELGNMQHERRREFRRDSQRGSGKHARSFSASGRLSSTPVKSNQHRERPQICDISSVRTGSTVGSVAGDAVKPSELYHFSADRFSRPLDDTKVGDTVTSSSALANFPPPNRKPVSMSPLPRLTPRFSEEGYGKKEEDISSTHKDYLRSLVRDIDDGSSSVVTGLTELQDLLKPHSLGLPHDGLRSPSEASDLPDRPLGLEVTPDDPHSDGNMWRHGNRSPAEMATSQGPDFHHKKGGIVDKFLRECRVLHTETDQVLNGSVPGGHKPSTSPEGTMEALKNMLFTMQSMTTADDLIAETENGETTTERGDGDQKTPQSPSSALSPWTKKLLDGNHGGDSLERAMVHLDRLKSMVKHKEQS